MSASACLSAARSVGDCRPTKAAKASAPAPAAPVPSAAAVSEKSASTQAKTRENFIADLIVEQGGTKEVLRKKSRAPHAVTSNRCPPSERPVPRGGLRAPSRSAEESGDRFPIDNRTNHLPFQSRSARRPACHAG